MIYQIVIPESVFEELNEATLYYEFHQKGLGLKFVLNWETTMGHLKKSPLVFQRKHKQLRSIQMSRFPYILVYEVIENKIYIYRLIHAQRNPKTIFK